MTEVTQHTQHAQGVTRPVQLHLVTNQIQRVETPSAFNSAHSLALLVSFSGGDPQSPSMDISQGKTCGHLGQDCRLPCNSGRQQYSGSSYSDTHLFRFPKSLYLSTYIFSSALSTTNGASQVVQWLKKEHHHKKQACQGRRCKRCGFDPWIRKTPKVGNGNPLQYSCLENPMDRRLLGYSPWAHKESVWLEHTHTHTYHHIPPNMVL